MGLLPAAAAEEEEAEAGPSSWFPFLWPAPALALTPHSARILS